MKKTLFIGLFFIHSILCCHALTPIEWNNRAIEVFKRGDLSAAVALLDKAIRQAPSRAVFYNNRGVIKAALGDTFGALADYNKVMELDSDSRAKALAYFNRAKLKMLDGAFDEAISDYTRSIELHPKYAPAYRGRAEAKQKSAETDLKRHEELAD